MDNNNNISISNDNIYNSYIVLILFVVTIIYNMLITMSILIKKNNKELKCTPFDFFLVKIIPGLDKIDVYNKCISASDKQSETKLENKYNETIDEMTSTVNKIKIDNVETKKELITKYENYVENIDQILEDMNKENMAVTNETLKINKKMSETLKKLETIIK